MSKHRARLEKNPSDQDLRFNLVKFGDPLVVAGESKLDLPLEETLVGALSLARRDATVARTLPVVFAKNQDQLDLTRLEFLARKQGCLAGSWLLSGFNRESIKEQKASLRSAATFRPAPQAIGKLFR